MEIIMWQIYVGEGNVFKIKYLLFDFKSVYL